MIVRQPNLNFRVAKALAGLDKLCFKKDAWTIEDWEKYFSLHVEVFFDMEDGVLAGAAVWERYPFARSGYLTSSAVLSEYRGKGIGTRLIHAREYSAREQGIRYLFAHTRLTNPDGQKILNRLGYIPNGIAPNFYEDESGLEWRKEI